MEVLKKEEGDFYDDQKFTTLLEVSESSFLDRTTTGTNGVVDRVNDIVGEQHAFHKINVADYTNGWAMGSNILERIYFMAETLSILWKKFNNRDGILYLDKTSYIFQFNDMYAGVYKYVWWDEEKQWECMGFVLASDIIDISQDDYTLQQIWEQCRFYPNDSDVECIDIPFVQNDAFDFYEIDDLIWTEFFDYILHPIIIDTLKHWSDIDLTRYTMAHQINFTRFLNHCDSETFSQLRIWIVNYGEGFLNIFMDICEDISLGRRLIHISQEPWIVDYHDTINNLTTWQKWFDRDHESYEGFSNIFRSYLKTMDTSKLSQKGVVLEDGGKYLRTFFRKISLWKDITIEDFNDNEFGYQIEQIGNGNILNDTNFSDIFDVRKYQDIYSFGPHHLQVVMDAIFKAFSEYGSFFCYKVFESFWKTISDENAQMFILKKDNLLLGTIWLKEIDTNTVEIGNFYLNPEHNTALWVGWILDYFPCKLAQNHKKNILAYTIMNSNSAFRYIQKSGFIWIDMNYDIYGQDFDQAIMTIYKDNIDLYNSKDMKKSDFILACREWLNTSDRSFVKCTIDNLEGICKEKFDNGFVLENGYYVWNSGIYLCFSLTKEKYSYYAS